MSRRKTTEEFIKEALSIHGDRYEYKQVDYVNNNKKVKIKCPKHGYFSQTPKDHLRGKGCIDCAGKRKKTTKDFVRDASVAHSYKYDYSKSIYVNNSTKVQIMCPDHGEFWQQPDNHISAKQGCPICGEGKKPGWDLKSWKRSGDKSINFNGFKLYVIVCENDFESFIKIGITFTDFSKRFYSLPYSWIVIEEKEGDAKTIWNLEKSLHSKMREYSYMPMIKFGGMYECFELSKESLEVLSVNLPSVSRF